MLKLNLEGFGQIPDIEYLVGEKGLLVGHRKGGLSDWENRGPIAHIIGYVHVSKKIVDGVYKEIVDSSSFILEPEIGYQFISLEDTDPDKAMGMEVRRIRSIEDNFEVSPEEVKRLVGRFNIQRH